MRFCDVAEGGLDEGFAALFALRPCPGIRTNLARRPMGAFGGALGGAFVTFRDVVRPFATIPGS